MKVAVLIGSDSDFEMAQESLKILKAFNLPFFLEVTSAHRTPRRTLKLIKDFEERGVEVFIAMAGKSAHLAGFIAAHTTKPVIGVPIAGQTLGGLDSLLSTVQMPKGVPVATVGLGKSGAANAALLAVQILALKDESLAKKLYDYRQKMVLEVERKSKNIVDKL